jgi:ATP-dependent RNA helicase MSS116
LTEAQLAAASATVSQALPLVSAETKGQAYRAFLGVYNTSMRSLKWTRDDLVAQANAFARSSLGWTDHDLPEIDRNTIGKMNLKGVEGLNVVKPKPRVPRGPPRG